MNSVPLTDVLPWGFDKPPAGGRTTLICDSSETDGRFLLHTIASQCLSNSSSNSNSNSSSNSRTTLAASSSASLLPTSGNSTKHTNAPVNSQYNILWINCGIKTEAQIYAAMKKIGCDVRTNESLVHIMNIRIPTEEDGNITLALEIYLKGFYQDIQRKTCSMSNYIIILDDATLLSTYFGPSLTFAFVQMLKALIVIRTRKTSIDTSINTDTCFAQVENDAGLIIRASHDLDQEHYLHSHSTQQEQKSVTGNKVLNYIGAGGKGILHDSESLAQIELGAQYELEEMVWERSLVELADGVIDVVPLASGFAKDVHGRLVFTSRWGAGLGWKKNDDSMLSSSTAKNNFSTTLVNFCCSDAGVRAIRLRV